MRYVMLILVAGIIFFACGKNEITNQYSNYDYSIEQKLSCFCPYSNTQVKLFVMADTISNVIKLSDNTQLPKDLWGRYKTIKELFDLIARLDTSTYDLKIEMDKSNKYPAFLSALPKPKIINDTLVQVISDMSYSYTTSNYLRNK